MKFYCVSEQRSLITRSKMLDFDYLEDICDWDIYRKKKFGIDLCSNRILKLNYNIPYNKIKYNKNKKGRFKTDYYYSSKRRKLNNFITFSLKNISNEEEYILL